MPHILGRFMKEKGVHTAVDVAHQAGVPILLAGLPVYDSDHRYCAEEVNPRIRPGLAACIGELGDREKNEFLGHAIALLLPVEIEEAFGLVLVEAMMCGTPAIAYRRGAIPEIIDEGVTGWWWTHRKKCRIGSVSSPRTRTSITSDAVSERSSVFRLRVWSTNNFGLPAGCGRRAAF